LVFAPAHEGALALLGAQAAALVCAPSPPPVVRAVSDRVADLFDALGPSVDAVVAWPWRATVGLDAGDVVLVFDARALARAPDVRGDALSDAGLMEIDADLVAAREALVAREVDALAPGDVLVYAEAGGVRDATAWLVMGAVEMPVARDERGWSI